MESLGCYVRLLPWGQTCTGLSKGRGLTGIGHSYNRYLAIASRVVRRSLQDDKRIAAEKRGEMELRFAKWEVRGNHLCRMALIPWIKHMQR